MIEMAYPHHALPGCEFRLAMARHADAEGLVTYMGMAPIPDDMPQAEADNLIAYLKHETHDAVVTLLGERRLTGVVWLIESGQAAIDLLDTFTQQQDDAQRLADYVPAGGEASTESALIDHLRAEPRSTLVIATAVVDSRTTAASMS